MSDFVLAESFGRKNFQDRLYYVMDEEDLETLLTEKNVVMGDKVYIIREQRMVIRGNDSEWYDIGNGGGGGGGGDSDEDMIVEFEVNNRGVGDVVCQSLVPAQEIIAAYSEGKHIVFHFPTADGFGCPEFYASMVSFQPEFSHDGGESAVPASIWYTCAAQTNLQYQGTVNDQGLLEFSVYID